MATFSRDHHRHFWTTLALLASLFLLLTAVAWFLAGAFGVVLTSLLALVTLFFAPRVPLAVTMRAAGALPLTPDQAPVLFATVRELAAKAGLARVPHLFLIPRPERNAFAAGRDPEFALAVTEGLLRSLDRRRLRAVIAHEISHIAHRDTETMATALVLNRLTAVTAGFGQFLFVLSLPLWLFADMVVPLPLIAALVLIPMLGDVLVSALSRTREFDADLGAARLSGDPLALAEALRLLAQDARPFWLRLLFPYQRRRRSSWLDTHPMVEERIARLTAYARAMHQGTQPETAPVANRAMSQVYLARPRWAEYGVFQR